jgi:hypothetical protein
MASKKPRTLDDTGLFAHRDLEAIFIVYINQYVMQPLYAFTR